MRHRTAFASLALAVLLVTAGCTGALNVVQNPTTDASASNNANAARSAGDGPGGSRTIEVGASGTVEAQPDRAVVRVTVTASGDDVGAVRERLAANASSMRAALKNEGVAGSDITTRYYDIGRNERAERESEAPQYRARHAFLVTIEEPDRAGEIIVAAIENGATEVDDVQFTITEDRRRELRQKALADAMDNARAEAGTLAEGANLTITGVHIVKTSDVNVRPHRQEVAFAAADGGAGAATDISSGPVSVTAQVQVSYNATG